MTQWFMNAAALVMLVQYAAIGYMTYDRSGTSLAVKLTVLTWAAYFLCMAGALVYRIVEWKRGQE